MVPYLLGKPLCAAAFQPSVLSAHGPFARSTGRRRVTIEAADNAGADIASVAGQLGKDKKLCIGVLSHRELQVELPDEIARLIRNALDHVEPDRLLLSSDCGFGRQGMSRTHAYYKMIAMVRGANIVRRELGLPEAFVPAGEPKFAL